MANSAAATRWTRWTNGRAQGRGGGLTAEERTEFLAEMRVTLASIQGILQGIGENDRERIVEAARQSGNRMVRATPESVRAKAPQAFRDLS